MTTKDFWHGFQIIVLLIVCIVGILMGNMLLALVGLAALHNLRTLQKLNEIEQRIMNRKTEKSARLAIRRPTFRRPSFRPSNT